MEEKIRTNTHEISTSSGVYFNKDGFTVSEMKEIIAKDISEDERSEYLKDLKDFTNQIQKRTSVNDNKSKYIDFESETKQGTSGSFRIIINEHDSINDSIDFSVYYFDKHEYKSIPEEFYEPSEIDLVLTCWMSYKHCILKIDNRHSLEFGDPESMREQFDIWCRIVELMKIKFISER